MMFKILLLKLQKMYSIRYKRYKLYIHDMGKCAQHVYLKAKYFAYHFIYCYVYECFKCLRNCVYLFHAVVVAAFTASLKPYDVFLLIINVQYCLFKAR